MSNTVFCNKLGILKFHHFINWIKIGFAKNLFTTKNRLDLKLSDLLNINSNQN